MSRCYDIYTYINIHIYKFEEDFHTGGLGKVTVLCAVFTEKHRFNEI